MFMGKTKILPETTRSSDNLLFPYFFGSHYHLNISISSILPFSSLLQQTTKRSEHITTTLLPLPRCSFVVSCRSNHIHNYLTKIKTTSEKTTTITLINTPPYRKTIVTTTKSTLFKLVLLCGVPFVSL